MYPYLSSEDVSVKVLGSGLGYFFFKMRSLRRHPADVHAARGPWLPGLDSMPRPSQKQNVDN